MLYLVMTSFFHNNDCNTAKALHVCIFYIYHKICNGSFTQMTLQHL